MKKILHIIAQQPGKTGSGIFIQSLTREAFKKGYRQAAVKGIPNKNNECILEYTDKNYPVLFGGDEIPFPVVGMSDVMPYESTRYCDLTDGMFKAWKESFTKRLEEAVKEFNPDLIIANHLWILTALVKELFPNIPVIGICHGTGIRQMTLAAEFSDYVKKGIKSIDSIIALNEYQKETISKLYSYPLDKILVTGVAYNSEIFYPSLKKKSNSEIKIVYAGKLSYAKGLISLLKVIESLSDKSFQGNKIKLILHSSGAGEEAEQLSKIIEDNPAYIENRGFVTQEKLADTYRECDIFILPSFYEGLPLVLIEALACGMKIVTTDLPGVKDWVGDDINSSGVIEYVKLPGLRNKDIPLEKDLPEFENRLNNALNKSIDKIVNNIMIDYKMIFNSLKDKTWEGLFSKIESLM